MEYKVNGISLNQEAFAKMLVEKARESLQYSYSPYSHFAVGAAVYCDDSNIYQGCNIENASYGATNCAERTAIFKAISSGVKTIKAIAIVQKSGALTPPCGVCRQVVQEFMEPDGIVILQDFDDVKILPFSEVLPLAFDAQNL